MAHAWDRSRQAIVNLVQYFIENIKRIKRAIRSDNGKKKLNLLFLSEKKTV